MSSENTTPPTESVSASCSASRPDLPPSKDIHEALGRLFSLAGLSWESTISIDDWKTLSAIDDVREKMEGLFDDRGDGKTQKDWRSESSVVTAVKLAYSGASKVQRRHLQMWMGELLGHAFLELQSNFLECIKQRDNWKKLADLKDAKGEANRTENNNLRAEIAVLKVSLPNAELKGGKE